MTTHGRDMTERWSEPTIAVNGRTLTEAQAMSVRVAVGHFLMELGDDAYADQLGHPLGANYADRLREVEALLLDV